MPARASRPCAKPACRSLAASGRYCKQHAEQAAQNAKNYDRARNQDPIRKLYHTTRWNYVRQNIIYRDPLCRACGSALSAEADHVVPAHQYIAQNGGDMSRFFDETNLQGLCKKCHSAKTAREGGFAGAHE